MKNTFVSVSSLEKVFPEKKPKSLLNRFSVLKNEIFHFQVACFSADTLLDCNIKIHSVLEKYIDIRVVECIPSLFSVRKGVCDRYIINKKKTCGLYPDLLREFRQGKEIVRQRLWQSFWLTIDPKKGVLPEGEHIIEIELYYTKCEKLFGKCQFCLNVLNESLPESDVIYTNWMHYDCIAHWHKAKPFSEEFYKYLNAYLQSAVRHGVTMLYTPLFTPPLDTAQGEERETVQLVDIEIKDGTYVFDFSRLEHFIVNARANGIKQFELSHLATQWGAEYCPKILGVKDNKEINLFGWNTRSADKEYQVFLDNFLSALSAFADKTGLRDCLFFHISDEPSTAALKNFKPIQKLISKYFPDAKIMDALSEMDFYKEGVINFPVVAIDKISPFLAEKIPCGVYYCGCHDREYVTNRLFNMPLQRTRILGIQLYAADVKMFLHWGFNFYSSVLSRFFINPYLITDAGGGFQSGDSFIVYPAADGVCESLRHEAIGEAFADYRALLLLEKKIGRQEVLRILKKEKIKGFSKYKRSARRHLSFRKKINDLICFYEDMR